MTVEEFLKLLPGPTALVGALIGHEAVINGYKTARINSELEARHFASYAESHRWEVLERPPLYKDPSARYCKWCKEPLGKGYSPRHGLEDGYCPTHGRAAPVLHAPLRFANVKAGIKQGDKLVEFKPTMEIRLPFPHKSDSSCILCDMGIPKKKKPEPEFKPITGVWPKTSEKIDEDTKRFRRLHLREALLSDRDNLFNALKIPKELLEGPPKSGIAPTMKVMEQRLKDKYGIR